MFIGYIVLMGNPFYVTSYDAEVVQPTTVNT